MFTAGECFASMFCGAMIGVFLGMVLIGDDKK